MPRALLLLLWVPVLLAGCSTERETDPPRTATEQLLISTAVDNALRDLDLEVPPGTRILVDDTRIDGLDHKYAVSAIRDYLLAAGGRMVSRVAEADVVVELRAGALSADRDNMLFGIPSLPVPVPLVGVMETPELPILKRAAQTGVAKLGITVYDANTGARAPYSPDAPIYGFSNHTRWTVLLFGFTDSDLLPEPARPRPQVGGLRIPEIP